MSSYRASVGAYRDGNSLDKAREIFDARIRLTIPQRTRVLQRWPQA